jgi:perosamine synthetase
MQPSRPYWHDFAGDNFRMTNLAAAVLLGQIERADTLCAGRNRVSRRYRELLAGIPGIELRPFAPWTEPVTWIEVLRVLPGAKTDRNGLLAALRNEGIDARSLWTPIVELPPYRDESARRGITTPRCRELLGQLLWLPTSSIIPDEDVVLVAECVRRSLG